MFETFSIKFINRQSFCAAISILKNGGYDKFFYDIGHADMIISFDNKAVLDAFVSPPPPPGGGEGVSHCTTPLPGCQDFF